jgi:hypothetical protein
VFVVVDWLNVRRRIKVTRNVEKSFNQLIISCKKVEKLSIGA